MKYSTLLLVCAISTQVLISCKAKSKPESTNKNSVQTLASVEKTGVIDITAQDFRFLLPDSLPSGWLNMRFHNKGKQTHLFLFDKIPEGVTYQDYLSEVAPPFDEVIKAIRDSGITKQEATKKLFAHMPKWISKAYSVGGSSLIEPGGTNDFTLKMEPGNYVMECYVLTPNDVFHYDLGMDSHVVFVKDSTNLKPPKADINLTLSDHKFISDKTPTAGKHTVAVHFKDPAPLGMGDDVHLVQLTDTTNINKVIDWMNWMNRNGLTAPAPARFLGGVQEMPQGNTAYFRVNLKPGHYAWISEAFASQGMVKQFTVE